jgi:hypothetical protein
VIEGADSYLRIEGYCSGVIEHIGSFLRVLCFEIKLLSHTSLSAQGSILRLQISTPTHSKVEYESFTLPGNKRWFDNPLKRSIAFGLFNISERSS